jgi:hypothetical protein
MDTDISNIGNGNGSKGVKPSSLVFQHIHSVKNSRQKSRNFMLPNSPTVITDILSMRVFVKSSEDLNSMS